jgi:TRAP transporter TAXI family solute receptor
MSRNRTNLFIRKAFALLACSLLLFLAGMGSSYGQTKIMITTAQVGGAWYPIGGAMASILSKSIPGTMATVQPGGGISNIFLVGGGKAEIGFGFPGDIANAQKGLADFKGKPITNIRAITFLYPGILHIAVIASSPIQSISDFKGRRLCVPPRGNTAEVMTRIVLKAHGLSYEDLGRVQFVSFADGADLLRDGNADIISAMSTVPFPALMDLARAKGLKLISIEAAPLQKLLKENPSFFEYTIPAGSYKGTDKPTKAIATPTILFTRQEMSEDLIYRVTKALFENKKELVAVTKTMEKMTIADGTNTGGIPLHPGALRYFNEMKKK